LDSVSVLGSEWECGLETVWLSVSGSASVLARRWVWAFGLVSAWD
jgi:hypothetical protein